MKWKCTAFDVHSGRILRSPKPSDNKEAFEKRAADLFGPSAAVERNHQGVEWIVTASKSKN